MNTINNNNNEDQFNKYQFNKDRFNKINNRDRFIMDRNKNCLVKKVRYPNSYQYALGEILIAPESPEKKINNCSKDIFAGFLPVADNSSSAKYNYPEGPITDCVVDKVPSDRPIANYLSVTPGGKLALANGNSVSVLDVKNNYSLIKQFNNGEYDDNVSCVGGLSYNKIVYVVDESVNTLVNVYDTETDQEQTLYENPNVDTTNFCRKNNFEFYTSNTAGYVLHDTRVEAPVFVDEPHSSNSNTIYNLDLQGHNLALGCQGSVKVFDIRYSDQQFTKIDHNGMVRALKFHPKKNILLSGCGSIHDSYIDDGLLVSSENTSIVKMTNLSTDETMFSKEYQRSVLSLIFSPLGRNFAVVEKDEIHFYQKPNKEICHNLVHTIPLDQYGPIVNIEYIPDTDHLVTYSLGGSVNENNSSIGSQLEGAICVFENPFPDYLAVKEKSDKEVVSIPEPSFNEEVYNHFIETIKYCR